MSLEADLWRSSGRRKARYIRNMREEPDAAPRFYVDKRFLSEARSVSYLRGLLSSLAAQERRSPLDKSFSSSGDLMQMVKAFSHTVEFQSILRESRTRLIRGETQAEIRTDLNGAMFENLVHKIISADAPNDLVVLSPDRAFKLAREMFPYAHEMYTRLSHLHGLKGNSVYTPDGFIVSGAEGDEPVILAAIEASMFSNESKFNRGFKNKYVNFKQTKRSFAPMTSDMHMIIVTPQLGFIPEIANKPDVALVTLGFKGQDFNGMVSRSTGL